MNKKASKKLKRLAAIITLNSNRPPEEIKEVYKRLKAVYKENKKAPK